jgi:peptide/nickel transport system substrate-binding protein
MKVTLYICLAVMLIGGLILGGCGEKTPSTTPTPTVQPTATTTPAATTPVKGGTLKMGTMLSGSTGDWAFPPTQMSDRYYNPAFEPLIREYLDGRTEPMLATKWEFSADYSSLTLTIRKGVKFHDGSDLNADVVKWNLDQQKEYKKPITQYFTSVDVIDDYTVKISISKYQNTILSNLANLVGLMYSKAAYEKNGLEWCKTNPVGTGPFKLGEYEKNVQTTWVKFDDYWQPGKPYLDSYQSIAITDLMTLQAAMLKGDVKVMLPAGGGSLAVRELQDKGYNVIFSPADPVCLWPDSTNPDSPFSKAEVRQAVSYAIDRDAISKLMGGYQVPAYQLPSPAYKAYDPTYKGTMYDEAKAKDLMAQAGYPDGFKTTLATPFIPRDILVAIQGYLSKIGIEAEITTIDMGQFVDWTTNGWKNALFAVPCTPYPNWAFGLQMQLSTSAVNLKSVARPEGIDSLLEQALSTPEEDVTKTREALKLLEDPCLVIPIFYAGSLYVCAPDVKDTGYLEIANSVYWTPEDAWISK